MFTNLSTAPPWLCVYSTLNALSLRVNWDVVPGASYYNLYRSPIPNDQFSLVQSQINGLTWYDNPQSNTLTLNIENYWYYEVTTTNIYGESYPSGFATYQPYYQLSTINIPLLGLSWSNLFQ